MAQTQGKQALDFKDVQNSPVSQANRQCRDVFCCLLFVANVIVMIYCTIKGYSLGKPSQIYRGSSGNGAICGISGGPAELYPYMYFYNPYSTNYRVCVDSCPALQSDGVTYSTTNCYDISNSTCNYVVKFNINGTANQTVNSADFIAYDSYVLLNRICIPSTAMYSGLSAAASSATDTLAAALRQSYISYFISDVMNSWKWLLCAVGFAFISSFIYMFLLRCLVGIIVWGSIFGVLFILVGLGIIFLYNGGALNLTQLGYLGIPTLQSNAYYNAYGYAMFGVAGFIFIVLLCCCSRIRLAVAICKVAGQFIVRVCLIMFVPIFMGLLSFGVWAACLIVMVYLISSATFTLASGDIFTGINQYTQNSLALFYYFVFATLWCNALIGAITIFVVASATCMFYYSHGPGQDLDSPILRSYKMAFRYHFGSLAFGSFILALVQFLQFIVELFKKQAEASGQNNKCFQYVVNCLRCCLACVERIVQFLNKTAYIQIALRGKNFCMAAKDGFDVVWSNAMRYAIVGGVGQIIMFLGKLMIAAGTTAAFYALITFIKSIKENIMEPLFLLLVVFILSYLIAMMFMSIYSVAMDALLACFIIDEATQKAKGGKPPQYAPEDLAKAMDLD